MIPQKLRGVDVLGVGRNRVILALVITVFAPTVVSAEILLPPDVYVSSSVSANFRPEYSKSIHQSGTVSTTASYPAVNASATASYSFRPTVSVQTTVGRQGTVYAVAELTYGFVAYGNIAQGLPPGPVDVSFSFAGSWMGPTDNDKYAVGSYAWVLYQISRGTYNSTTGLPIGNYDVLAGDAYGNNFSHTIPGMLNSFQLAEHLTVQAYTPYFITMRAIVEGQYVANPLTMSAFLDPIITIETPGYSLLLSDGVGNGAISAVPEPSTWAMILLGFAGVGFLARRRRSQWSALMAA